jgi:hypothetical protein
MTHGASGASGLDLVARAAEFDRLARKTRDPEVRRQFAALRDRFRGLAEGAMHPDTAQSTSTGVAHGASAQRVVRGRDREAEASAATGVRLCPNAAAMGVDDRAAYGESDAHAVLLR